MRTLFEQRASNEGLLNKRAASCTEDEEILLTPSSTRPRFQAASIYLKQGSDARGDTSKKLAEAAIDNVAAGFTPVAPKSNDRVLPVGAKAIALAEAVDPKFMHDAAVMLQLAFEEDGGSD